jgi:hypothetical protein
MSRHFGSVMLSSSVWVSGCAPRPRGPGRDCAGRAGKEERALVFLRSSEIALIADFDVGRWALRLPREAKPFYAVERLLK